MFEKEIEKGAALLDIKNPGWRKKINLNNLNMVKVSYCILGQLYENYFIGLERIGINNETGYNYGYSSNKSNFDKLTQEWKDYLSKQTESSSILNTMPQKLYSMSQVEELLLKVMELGMTTRENQILGKENKSGKEVLEQFIKDSV
jgi:hypothetical protein